MATLTQYLKTYKMTKEAFDSIVAKDKAFFDKYLQGQLAKIDLEKPDHQFLRERMLTMYANPARNQLILSAK